MKRIFDLSLSCVLLIVLAPAMALIAIAIVARLGRPLLFCPTRAGLHAEPFMLFKFRTMQSSGAADSTAPDSERMTPLGSWLRSMSLDELPQLWNVLAGDMSLVGPRPESLSFADCFQGAYRRLLDHRPGIFGPAQTMFRNEAAFYPPLEDPETVYREVLFPAKAVLDLSYYPTRTVSKDLAWICRGVLAVVTGLSHRPQRLGEDLGRASSP